jgi:hypothetical protein
MSLAALVETRHCDAAILVRLGEHALDAGQVPSVLQREALVGLERVRRDQVGDPAAQFASSSEPASMTGP